VPPEARAIELIEEECLSASEAQIIVDSFNRQMLNRPDQVWAVAIPVSVRYEGDARPGAIVHGHSFPSPEST
jgi:hypothetical protein